MRCILLAQDAADGAVAGVAHRWTGVEVVMVINFRYYMLVCGAFQNDVFLHTVRWHTWCGQGWERRRRPAVFYTPVEWQFSQVVVDWFAVDDGIWHCCMLVGGHV